MSYIYSVLNIWQVVMMHEFEMTVYKEIRDPKNLARRIRTHEMLVSGFLINDDFNYSSDDSTFAERRYFWQRDAILSQRMRDEMGGECSTGGMSLWPVDKVEYPVKFGPWNLMTGRVKCQRIDHVNGTVGPEFTVIL